MRHYAVLTISVSALFLLFVGAFLNTRSLFYMSTVLIVTLLVLRGQAWLATRGLEFERIAPTVMLAGERVAMRIRVRSLLNIRRPLLFVLDELPPSLAHDADIRPLPVAPSYEQAVETRYELNPLKRGVYKWSDILVQSFDSLGLIRIDKVYSAEPFQITIHPAKIPLSLDLSALGGWGTSQSEEGRSRGHGIEPRGVREFGEGDSLRHVHWRTTARMGTLQVKEFETGFYANLAILLQLTSGTAAGSGTATTLEAMCGHAAYISDVMLQRGSAIVLPNLERGEVAPAHSAGMRFRQVCDALASAQADRPGRFADELIAADASLPAGTTVLVMLSAAEGGVAAELRKLATRCSVLVLVYNPEQYSGSKSVGSFYPATDPDFLASISAPNISIKVVPNPYGSQDKRR
jgi:uncharacterized protein (DUF58 family)